LTFPNGNQLRYSTLPNDQGIDDAVKFLEKLVLDWGVTPIFHNGAGYDLKILYQFYPQLKEILTVYNTVDTMLLSCILVPDKPNGHSLDAYGEDLGIAKVQNEDWSTVTEHMVGRCVVDTEITMEVYNRLYSKACKYDLEVIWKSLTLESEVSHIHQDQANYGIRYDVAKAMEHWAWLDNETERLRAKIQDEAPWKCMIPTVAKSKQQLVRHSDGVAKHTMGYREVEPFTKAGGYKKVVVDFWGPVDIYKVQGPYVKIECSPLDLGNSDEVKSYLRSLGWKPTEWNYKFEDGRKKRTSPKLTEDSYASLPPGLGQDIAHYNTYMHRKRSIMNINQDTGEVKGAIGMIRDDGRIGAEAFTCGTPTARYRHAGTVCNIPRPSSVFGAEIRETFCVPECCLLIGADLSGIEARMLAHFLLRYVTKDHEIIKAILETDKGKDFHSRNAKIWGVDRNTAKRGLYALTNQRM